MEYNPTHTLLFLILYSILAQNQPRNGRRETGKGGGGEEMPSTKPQSNKKRAKNPNTKRRGSYFLKS